MLIGLAPMAYVELRAHLIEQRARRLRAQVRPILDRRLEHLAGHLDVDALAVILATDLTSRDTSALVIDEEGRVIGRPPAGVPAPPAPVLPPERYRRAFEDDPHVTYVLRGEAGELLLVALIPPLAWRPHPPAVIQLTTDLAPERRILARLAGVLGVGAFAIACIALTLEVLIGGPADLLALAGVPLLLLASRATRRRIATVEELRPSEKTSDDGPAARADFAAVMRRVEAAFLARQASEERMRRFVADAAHELRTPLTSLGGAADVLMVGGKHHPEHVERLARVIRTQADRMGALVEDLLTLARLDSGIDLQRGPVRLDRLAREHAHELALAAADRRVRATRAEPVIVTGDAERLHRLIGNLTSNALRHTAPAGTIEIAVVREDGEALLSVRDDGEGIRAADLPRVFERFYRGDEARSGTGSGLGLAIVREIAQAHAGRVALQSEPGRGTTVEVRLPLASSPSESAPARPLSTIDRRIQAERTSTRR